MLRALTVCLPFVLFVVTACGGAETGTGAGTSTNGVGDSSENVDAGTSDSTPTDCVPECGADQVCVRSQFEGGPLLVPDDAGACPAGRHAESGQCVPDPTYACAARPSACGTSLDCTCASALCTGGYTCAGTTGREVSCREDVP